MFYLFVYYFYRATAWNATHGFAVAILSVRLSVRCAYCDSDKTKWCTTDILIPHKRAITLVFWHQQWLVGDALPSEIFPESDPPTFEKNRIQQISAHNVSAIRDSQKSSFMSNIKLTMGFPTSYRWSAYVTPKPRNGWLKNDFLFFLNNSQLQLNKVCYKVSVCENFKRQCCITTILYLMVHRY